jgi:hypothetical protein
VFFSLAPITTIRSINHMHGNVLGVRIMSMLDSKQKIISNCNDVFCSVCASRLLSSSILNHPFAYLVPSYHVVNP